MTKHKPPAPLERATHIELRGRRREIYIRRVGVALLAAFTVAALADVFGQRPSTAEAEGDGVRLSVNSPTAVRGGLIFQARFDVDVRKEVKDLRLLLDSGWFEGLTLNSIQPDPVEWAQDRGRNVLDFGHIPAGRKFTIRLQYQVNPTSVGRRDQDVTVADGDRLLASVSRTATVYP
jgi:hypothetical protein